MRNRMLLLFGDFARELRPITTSKVRVLTGLTQFGRNLLDQRPRLQDMASLRLAWPIDMRKTS